MKRLLHLFLISFFVVMLAAWCSSEEETEAPEGTTSSSTSETSSSSSSSSETQTMYTFTEGDTDIGGTISEAMDLTPSGAIMNDTLRSILLVGGKPEASSSDTDVYKVAFASGHPIKITMTHDGPPSGGVFQVFNASGDSIEWFYNDATNVDLLTWIPIGGTEFYVLAGLISTATQYQLLIQPAVSGEYCDEGNGYGNGWNAKSLKDYLTDVSNIGILSSGTTTLTATGSICECKYWYDAYYTDYNPAGDFDLYTFTADLTGTITITVTPSDSALHLMWWVFNVSGTTMAMAFNGSSSINVTSSGLYYLQVMPYYSSDECPSGEADYSISMTVSY